MESFLGATISLVSRSDIRYVGVLHSINQAESTVALENGDCTVLPLPAVRSFGTEGRKGGNPIDEIPPSPQVFEFIVFRGSDIKDLQVVTAPQLPQPPPSQFVDPAIISATQAKQTHQQTPPVQLVQQQQPAPVQQTSVRPGVSVPAIAKPAPPAEVKTAHTKPTTRPSDNPNSAEVIEKFENLEIEPNKAIQPRPQIPKTDFDFESMNAKFNKNAIVTNNALASDSRISDDADAKTPETTDETEQFYNKETSFFDNISCDAKDRADRDRRVFRGQEERKMNMETFGQTSINNNRRGGRRGGRGGRGGRGNFNKTRAPNGETATV
ncbi:hypothetical protein HDU83_002792 [Entophlyctis luteolus]|nr:hypothetical protein HDU83_002792 [Entophlyctis luteolus]